MANQKKYYQNMRWLFIEVHPKIIVSMIKLLILITLKVSKITIVEQEKSVVCHKYKRIQEKGIKISLAPSQILDIFT